jgi:hypothetical protein
LLRISARKEDSVDYILFAVRYYYSDFSWAIIAELVINSNFGSYNEEWRTIDNGTLMSINSAICVSNIGEGIIGFTLFGFVFGFICSF